MKPVALERERERSDGWLLYRGRERGNPWHLMVSERIEAKRVDGDKMLDSTIMKYLRLENDIRKEK